MNLIFAALIFAGTNLFFLKGKNELVVKYVPTTPQNQYTSVYARNNGPWEEVIMRRSANWFYYIVPYDSTIKLLSIYFKSGATVDDNSGSLYLYEVKLSPRMIFAISLKQLDQMLKSADAKLLSKTTKHDESEATTSINYAMEILNLIPDPIHECILRTEKRRLLDYASSLLTRQ